MIDKTAKVGRYCEIHPAAQIGKNVIIKDYVSIGAGAVIGDGVVIGRYCEIRENVKVGSGTTFGSRCTISANGKIGENCTIKYSFVLTDTPDITKDKHKEAGSVGNNVAIGANVVLLPSVKIGDNAIVGAMSQVRHDVPKGKTVYGNPC